MLLAYAVILVGTYLLVTTITQAWYILIVWMAGLTVICSLGIFQFFGFDFFSSAAGRLLILPTRYQNLAPLLKFNFPRYYVYGTLFNPNQLGSMISMAFPVAAAGFILSSSNKHQIIFGVLAGLLCLILIGSNARAGWMADLFAMVGLGILCIKRDGAGWWKRLSILALVAILEFGVLDFTSGGALGRRDSQTSADVGQVVENTPT